MADILTPPAEFTSPPSSRTSEAPERLANVGREAFFNEEASNASKNPFLNPFLTDDHSGDYKESNEALDIFGSSVFKAPEELPDVIRTTYQTADMRTPQDFEGSVPAKSPIHQRPQVVQKPPVSQKPPVAQKPAVTQNLPSTPNHSINQYPALVQKTLITHNPPISQYPPMLQKSPVAQNPPASQYTPLAHKPPITQNAATRQNLQPSKQDLFGFPPFKPQKVSALAQKSMTLPAGAVLSQGTPVGFNEADKSRHITSDSDSDEHRRRDPSKDKLKSKDKDRLKYKNIADEYKEDNMMVLPKKDKEKASKKSEKLDKASKKVEKSEKSDKLEKKQKQERSRWEKKFKSSPAGISNMSFEDLGCESQRMALHLKGSGPQHGPK